MLRMLKERCDAAQLPNWEFRLNEGELIAAHYKEGIRGGTPTARYVWKLDDQNRLSNEQQATATSIDRGADKAVDEAVALIAMMVIDADEPNR